MPSNDEQDVKKVDTRRVGEDIDEEVPSRYRLIRLNEDWHKSASGKRSKDKNAPKRKHRKSHGKIGFLELSSVISKRWHQLNVLDAETKTYVTKIAKQLLEEYKREMATFKAQSAAANSSSNNSVFSSFPGMSSLPLSFQPYPKITYPPPPSFHGGHAPHSSPSKPPRVAFDAISYASDSVDGDQLLQEGPLSFAAKSSDGNQLPIQGQAPFAASVAGDKMSKESSVASEKEQGKEEGMVGEDNQMPSKFTFFPVTSRAYTKRKSMEDDIDVREERRHHRHHHSSSNKKRKHLTRKDIESEKSKLKRKIRAMRDQMRKNEEMNCFNRDGGDDEIQYDYDSARSMIENEIDSFMARHFEPGARSRERRQSSSSSSSNRKKSERWEETPSRSRSQMNYYSASSYTPCHYELEGRYSSSRQKEQRDWKTPSPSGSETEGDYCPAPCPISPEHELKMSSGDAEDLMRMLGTAEAEWCN